MKLSNVFDQLLLISISGIVLMATILLLGPSLPAFWGRATHMFGPLAIIFFLMGSWLIAEALLIVFIYTERPVLGLTYFIQEAAPAFGLLGTVLSLIFGFGKLNLATDQLEESIQAILDAIAVALTTTAAGILLSLCAMALTRFLVPLVWEERRRVSQ